MTAKEPRRGKRLAFTTRTTHHDTWDTLQEGFIRDLLEMVTAATKETSEFYRPGDTLYVRLYVEGIPT